MKKNCTNCLYVLMIMDEDGNIFSTTCTLDESPYFDVDAMKVCKLYERRGSEAYIAELPKDPLV